MPRSRVVVIGTTCDYVDLLRIRHPGRLFFLTDRCLRENAREADPGPAEEALADLLDESGALAALEAGLAAAEVSPSGIACYDCESLPLAAEAARRFGLPFVSREATEAARSKRASKERWRAAGVPCPEGAVAATAGELTAALALTGFPAILKPVTGAGSELVFRAETPHEAQKAFEAIRAALAAHADVRLYPEGGADSARGAVSVERCLCGPEFSAEILLGPGGARLVRVAGKVAAPELGAGTALAYYVPAHGNCGLPVAELLKTLERAAQALGISGGIAMADFFVEGGRPLLLEMTPRPSGDCLPWLTEASSGLDTLGLALDLAEGRPVTLPQPEAFAPLAGLRLFAPREGTVRAFDVSRLVADPRVRQVRLYRQPGHKVVFPPREYASRVLGHAIFAPADGVPTRAECDELAARFSVSWEEKT